MRRSILWTIVGLSSLWTAIASYVASDLDNCPKFPFELSFLNDEQKVEFLTTVATDQSKFLTEIYEHSDAAEKSRIRSAVIPKCYSSFIPAEQLQSIEELHNSGDHTKCKEKIRTILESLSAEERSTVDRYWAFCEHLWYLESDHAEHHDHDHHKGHHHKRFLRHLRRLGRRHIHHSFESFSAEHLQWLSDAERADLKQIVDTEGKEKAKQKIEQLYDATSGETRQKATAQLQAACRELIVDAVGEEGANQLKKLKEAGTSDDEIAAKVDEMIKAIKVEEKKTRSEEYREICKKVYKSPSRKRREGAHHELESKLKSEWKWLNDDQKAEIRQLKKDGKKDDVILSKVFEFFKNAQNKAEAEDGLQTSCGSIILTILGTEKAEQLKAFMANGATPAAYEAKVKELLSQPQSPQRKLSKNEESCRLVFTESAGRRRRHDHHKHDLEHYLATHLSWLTDQQKSAVRELKAEGKGREEIQTKVMEYYEAASGDQKEKATAALQEGCRAVLAGVIGEEGMLKVKEMKESGSTSDQIAAKVEELVKAVGDTDKVKASRHYEANCKKLFGVSMSRRRRHDHEHKSLEDHLGGHLSWLTDEQKEAVRQQKAGGQTKEQIQTKIMGFFDSATGDQKAKATATLQEGCREIYAHFWGPEKTTELKRLKESGASNEELKAKGAEFIQSISDDKHREEAKFYAVGCRKVFGVSE